MLVKDQGIASIALPLFPQATTQANGDRIDLTLTDSVTVSYSKVMEEAVLKAPTNSKLHKHLRFAFQKFQFKTIDEAALERKIRKIVNRRISPPKVQIATEEASEDAFLKADKLFKAGVSASTQAIDQDIVLVIGSTGSGKSTVVNDLGGCNMRKIERILIGKGGNPKEIIIAEHPLTKIGHRRESQTSYPQVILDQKNKLAFCDCPGFEDTGGSATDIYNALLILDVIERSKAIKGFMVVIDYPTFQSSRGNWIVTNLKYLQLLLKDFRVHERAVLFVITKISTGVDLKDIKKDLKSDIRKVINKHKDKELKEFCQQILDSGILDNVFGDRVMISDPCGQTGEKLRKEMLDTLQHFTPNILAKVKGGFGYPISERVQLELEKTRRSIVTHARKTLLNLQLRITEYWKLRTENSTIEETKECLDELEKWLKKLSLPTSAHFAYGEEAIRISPEFTDILKQCLVYWTKMDDLDLGHPIDDDLVDSLKYLEIEITRIRDETEALWYQRMHQATKASLEEGLQAYFIQSDLANITSIFNPHTLTNLNVKELCQVVHDLAIAAKVKLKYEDLLEIILQADPTKCTELKSLIKTNLLEPFQVNFVTDKIIVKANANKIALSEVLKRTGSYLDLCREFWITLNINENSTLYFDQDLIDPKFKGKLIYFFASLIELQKTCKVNLDISEYSSAILTLKGRLKGKEQLVGNELTLSEEDQASEMKILRFQWPI